MAGGDDGECLEWRHSETRVKWPDSWQKAGLWWDIYRSLRLFPVDDDENVDDVN